MNVHDCKSLTYLPPALGDIESLEVLHASNSAIRVIPDDICSSKSLKILDVRGCFNLHELPTHLSNIESLEEIYISGTRVSQLPPPIDGFKGTDGVSFTVSVELKDFTILALDLLSAISERRKALTNGDDYRASNLMKIINNTSVDYGYLLHRVVELDVLEFVVKKYTIKLSANGSGPGFRPVHRGIRAPEIGMDDGIKARNELVKMLVGKCLKISVYHLDEKMHCVGDAYFGKKILQDVLLKKGAALCWGWKRMENEP
ncbi:hypothetical protein M8C21_030144 [Ambrosia artemisiifolia]|uniref:Uncharacterized protein n=1 Tax=Ambrosia artemisiifolia TaxID=4212 RepID=A0AAD5CZV3_AMBAR|nr:hypothetical protein M8C21_030144 [Ambrosia artemisiifolia]